MLSEELLLDSPIADDDLSVEDAPVASDDYAIEGISFTVPEGFSRRECFILRQALYMLSDANDPTYADLNFIFRRNEHRIHQIARRLISTVGANVPVVIGPSAFRRA